MKNAYLLIAFLLLGSQVLLAQCNPDPDPMSGLDCFSAELLCCGEFTGITGTLPDGGPPFGPNPLCPGSATVPNNTSWYSFVAGSTTMIFELIFTNCTPTQTGNGGAQVGVYEGCDFAVSVYCNGDENVGLLNVPLNNLIIGQAYFFFLDGFAGSVCDYEINLLQGSNFTVDPGAVLDILGPQEVCVEDTRSYSATLDFGATSVVWTVPPGIGFINSGNSITINDWGDNAGNTVTICADGVNDCAPIPNGLTQFCRTIDVVVQNSISVTESYCSSEIGYLFPENGLFYAEGVHEVFVSNGQDCADRYELEISVATSENINENYFMDLGETYTVNGVTYIAPFFGQFENGQTGSNGCPQTLTLNLTTVDQTPQIQTTDSIIVCGNTAVILSALHDIEQGLEYTYEWQTTDGCILGPNDTNSTTIGCGGVYDLTITTSGEGQSGPLSVQTFASIEIFEINTMELDITGSDVSCLNEGTAEVVVTGGEPPYDYNWSHGPVTAAVTDLMPGDYFVTVTDVTQCTVVSVISIDPVIDLEVNGTLADCDLEDGTATATVLGGATDPTFLWSNGQIGATAIDLAPDYYSVTVTDQANGCQTHENVQVLEDPSCNVFISGNVVIDENLDCIRDPSNVLLQNFRVELSDGQIDFTDINGQYSFIAEPGTYEISISNYPIAVSLLCDSILTVDALTLGESYEDNDYHFEYDPPIDIQLKVVKFNARPGFQQQVRICLMNIGGNTASGTLSMTHPSMIDFLSSNPINTAYDTAAFNLTWEYTDIPPGAVWIYTPSFYIPVDLPIGTALDYEFEASVSNGTDINLDNNYIFCPFQVTGAYDPNDKTASPAGEGVEGLINAEDTAMSYTIRFQNTGNDTAFTVLLRDTLSTEFDLSTFTPGPASHNYSTRIIQGNILEVLFENILLPDSFVNEPASNGFFIFDIHLKSNLAPGTVINNTAGIYFDFNPPIVTNTTVNTIRTPVGVSAVFEPIEFTLRPNPTSNNVYLEFDLVASEQMTLTVFDLVGKKLMTLNQDENFAAGKHIIQVDLSSFTDGVYFIRIESDSGKIGTQKIVKLK